MGNIIQAVCSCRLESEIIHQGIGFRYFENSIRIEPAYCDQCGIVKGKDISKAYCKCPQCSKKMNFYKDEVEDSELEKEFGIVTDDYLQQMELWHCPRCKNDTLRFENMGCWD